MANNIKIPFITLCAAFGILLGAQGNVYVNGERYGAGQHTLTGTSNFIISGGSWGGAGGATFIVGCDSTVKLCGLHWAENTGKPLLTIAAGCKVKLNVSHGDNGSYNEFCSKDTSAILVKGGATLTIDSDDSGVIKYVNDAGGNSRAIEIEAGGGVIMNGGTISGWQLSSEGAAVYNRGTFTMNGGTISGCSASEQGGAIYNKGTLTINGGTISGCSTADGGALLNYGTANIYGGTFTGNSASRWGGFCYCNTDCAVSIYGGYFSGNSAPEGQCNLYHGCVWQANGKLYGGVFAANPTATAESNGTLVLQDGMTVKQVGSNYVVGRSMTWSGTVCSAGVFRFPLDQYAASAGWLIASGKACTAAGDYYCVVSEDYHHCVCGSDTCSGEGHTPKQVWQPTVNLPKAAGYWYLVEDVAITSSWAPPTGVYLSMNGKTVTMTGNDRVVNVNGGVALTVTDYAGWTAGKITGGDVSREGGAFYVGSGGALDIYRIVISGNTASSGGGIRVNSGGTCRFHSGTISGNSASNGGGGVSNGGTFEMTGGTIGGNKVTTAQDGWNHVGGGVQVNGGTFNLSNGYIVDNSAPSGGGVAVKAGAAFNQTGGTIAENTATHWGGGVAVESSGRYALSGGEIVNNATSTTSEGLGGGICASGGFSMTDGLVRGNTGSAGAALYLNVDTGKKILGGLVYGAQFADSGTTAFCGGVFDRKPADVADGYDVVSVGDYYTIAQSGTGASAGGILTAGRYTFDPLGAKYVALGIVSTKNYYTSIVGSDPTIWQLTSTKPIDCATWAELRSNLSVGNDVMVSKSFTVNATDLSVTIPASRSPTLDLGGNTITSQFTKPLFDLTAGGTLTVRGGGFIETALPEAAHNGGCFNVTAGSLEIAGGTYEGFRVGTGYHGGCVYVGENASFALTGGVITNCWAGGSGGAIASKGICSVSGGLLTRNGAANPGGALAALGGATVVTNGEFAANGSVAASTNGAAVAALDGANLILRGGYYHDNVTAETTENDKGTGAAVYLNLNGNGSATILGGLFGPNKAGGAEETRNILVDTSKAKTDDNVTVYGGFLYGQDPATLGTVLADTSEGVAVRTDWWTIAQRNTVKISNDCVYEGTFTFDPVGQACYLQNGLVPNGAKSIYTAGGTSAPDTWQLSTVNDNILYYEGRCVLPDGTTPTGNHLFRTYLATAIGDVTSETNHVVVQLDANGYYAAMTPLDVCDFLDRHSEAYLVIDIYDEKGETLVQHEPRQKIGAVPYALHAARAEWAQMDALSAEKLTVAQSARITNTLTITSSLVVNGSATLTNDWANMQGKVSTLTIDAVNLSGTGTSLLEPVGGLDLDPSARSGWTSVATSGSGTIRPQDGTVEKSVNCAYDGILFVVGSTTGTATLKLDVARTDREGATETLFARDGLAATGGKGIDLTAVVVRGDTVKIEATAAGEGEATVKYRYVTFGSPREER